VSLFTFEMFTAQVATPEPTTDEDAEFWTAEEDEEDEDEPDTSSVNEPVTINPADVITIEEARAAKRQRQEQEPQLTAQQMWNLLTPSASASRGH
jgi:hypothetical protein